MRHSSKVKGNSIMQIMKRTRYNPQAHHHKQYMQQSYCVIKQHSLETSYIS